MQYATKKNDQKPKKWALCWIWNSIVSKFILMNSNKSHKWSCASIDWLNYANNVETKSPSVRIKRWYMYLLCVVIHVHIKLDTINGNFILSSNSQQLFTICVTRFATIAMKIQKQQQNLENKNSFLPCQMDWTFNRSLFYM